MRRAAALVLAAALSACSPLDGLDAFDALVHLTTGADPGRGDPRPERHDVTWQGDRDGDLYLLPGLRVEAAVVLVPGLAPQGRRDPRLMLLADMLARKRFAVLVPDMPSFRAQQVSAADKDQLADALRFLRQRPEGQGPLGIIAISYAAGPAILAVLEPDLRDEVDFVVAIGGYYDTVSVATFFTTGYFRDARGMWRQAVPNAYGKWVFVLANAERVRSAVDRVALTAMARRKLADLNAEIGDLEAGLGEEGQAVAALLANRDPERVPGLVERLPPAIREDLQALSLAGRDLTATSARFLLVHGRDDAIVPYSESERLAERLPAARVTYVRLDSLAHVDLSFGSALDLVRSWWAMLALMAQRR
jgi:pimeloyl-ACP methyl ester carboxylesterase